MSLVADTHQQDLHVFGDAILPCDAEDMREVKCEVNDAATGSCKVGLIEEDTQQEALHDGCSGEGEQEEEKNKGVAVVQNSPSLERKHITEELYDSYLVAGQNSGRFHTIDVFMYKCLYKKFPLEVTTAHSVVLQCFQCFQ